MYTKSHIETRWCIILSWHWFMNDLRYKSSDNAHCFPRWFTAFAEEEFNAFHTYSLYLITGK